MSTKNTRMTTVQSLFPNVDVENIHIVTSMRNAPSDFIEYVKHDTDYNGSIPALPASPAELVKTLKEEYLKVVNDKNFVYKSPRKDVKLHLHTGMAIIRVLVDTITGNIVYFIQERGSVYGAGGFIGNLHTASYVPGTNEYKYPVMSGFLGSLQHFTVADTADIGHKEATEVRSQAEDHVVDTSFTDSSLAVLEIALEKELIKIRTLKGKEATASDFKKLSENIYATGGVADSIFNVLVKDEVVGLRFGDESYEERQKGLQFNFGPRTGHHRSRR